MTRLRSRLERLAARRRPQGEIWWRDLTSLGDGLCRPSGAEEPALTLAEYEALPDDRRRVLLELADVPEHVARQRES